MPDAIRSRGLSRRGALISGAALAACGSALRVAPESSSASASSVGALQRLAGAAEAIVAPSLAAEGIPGAAFVAFDQSGEREERHWGVADREAGAAVGADTVWPLASVTKVLTAASAMTLVEQGRTELDAAVSTRLRSLQLPDFEGPAITLRHLLSHTAGFDEVRGRIWTAQTPPPRVADFLRTGKLVRIRPAGELTAYSSYAIAVASVLIEDVSGRRYEDYVREALFEPLSMSSARFMREARDARGVAAGYVIEDGAAQRTDHEIYVTTAASSAVCTIADISRFGAMLLSGARVLSAPTAAEMLRQQATVHLRVPGWGLGVQLDMVGGRRIVEHGGDIGGFACLLTLVPELGVGFFTVHHGEGGDLRFRVRESVLNAIAPEVAQPPQPDAQMSRRLSDYAGRYRSTLDCYTCGGDATAFEVRALDGAIELWGQRWIPVDADFFLRDDGLRSLGFKRDDTGRVVAVSGGAWRVATRMS